VILLTVSAGLFAQKSVISGYLEQIDSVKMLTYLSALASDEFEGRGTGQRGNDIAQEYIAACLDSCGIKPGNGSSYFQDLNSIKSFNAARKRFTVNGDDFPNDYKYENQYNQDTILNINEIIFIASNKETAAGIKPGNIKDKVIMKLSDVSLEYADDQIPGTVIDIFLDFKPVSSEISERVYYTPPESKYKYNKVNIDANLANRIEGIIDEFESKYNHKYNYNRVNIDTKLANRLLKSKGKTVEGIIDELEKTGKPKIITLKTSAEIHGNVKYAKMNVNNIIGVIEGSDLKNEYIVLSAHYDHMGIMNGNTYYGADDNASGVSSILEIARIVSKAKKEGNGLRRSLVLLFPAAEEMGLIGSSYYVKNPVFPLADAKACINVDMVGRIDGKYKSTGGDYIYIVNDKQKNGNLFEHVKNSNSDSITINAEDLNSLFNRSDHYNFAKNNIPAVLLTSGLHNDYHTPRDRVELINLSAMWKRNRFIFSLVWNLGNDFNN
jgi:hypothetical protein